MRTIIIGCGYVGSSLARFWRLRGHHVAVTTRNIAKRDSLCSIADEVIVGDHWERAAASKDVIVVAVAPDSPELYECTYLGTAHKLLPHVDNQQIIYLSSTSVYGDNPELHVNEESELFPANPQARILAEAERLFLTAANSCVLRLGEIVGPGRSPLDRLKKMSSALPGTGENPINLSPLELIIDAINLAAERKLKGIFNVCSDDHRTRKEYYAKICAEHALEMPVWDPTKKSLHGGKRIVSSNKLTLISSSHSL